MNRTKKKQKKRHYLTGPARGFLPRGFLPEEFAGLFFRP